jgi:hypothetical protein
MKKILITIALGICCSTIQAQFIKLSSANLLTKIPNDAVKIIDSNAVLYMTNKNIIKALRIASKENGQDYSVMIKKLKGVCFTTINLTKKIDDLDITVLQNLLREEVISRAIIDGKVALFPLKSNDPIPTITVKMVENNVILNRLNQRYLFLDANGKIMFDGSYSKLN